MINRGTNSDELNLIKKKLETNHDLTEEEKDKLRENLVDQDIHPDFYQLKVA